MKWRTGHPIFGQHSASTIQKIMSGGSSFLPFLSLKNRQHLIQIKSSLLDHLNLWTVCSKLRHMGPSRTPSEVSVWLKFPPAPQHKDSPLVKLNSKLLTWPISQSLPTPALDAKQPLPIDELWWVVGAISVGYWDREARPVSIDFVALLYTVKTVTHYGHI